MSRSMKAGIALVIGALVMFCVQLWVWALIDYSAPIGGAWAATNAAVLATGFACIIAAVTA